MSSSSSWSSKLHYNFGSVSANRFNVLDKGSVTQGTSITTSVQLPAPVGVIRTVNTNLGALTSTYFKAEHSSIVSDSIIFTSIGSYGGNNLPYVSVVSFSTGSCTLGLSNISTAGSLSAPVTIAYNII